METINFRVDQEEQGIRIDKYLASRLPDYSRSFLQKLVGEGQVLAEGKPVKSNYKISAGEQISLSVPDAVEPEIVPEPIPLDILYEDASLLVINKPKGMVVHPCPGHYSGTLVNALMYHCGDSLSGINGEHRPGIVHRIDKDTSGLLIIEQNGRRPPLPGGTAEGSFHHQEIPGHRPRKPEGRRGHGKRSHRQTSGGPEKNGRK